MARSTTSERRRLLTDTSLVAMTLADLRPLRRATEDDEAAIQHRFVQVTSLTLLLLMATGVAVSYGTFGALLVTPGVIATIAALMGSILGVYLLSRRFRGRWLAYLLVILLNILPLAIAAVNPMPISRASVSVLMIPAVVAAGPLLGPWHAIAVALLDAIFVIVLDAVSTPSLGPEMAHATRIVGMRVGLTLLATAAISWFFASGIRELIAAARAANHQLTDRAERQGILAHLGQRALASFDDLVRSALRRVPRTLGIGGCAFFERGVDGRWSARLTGADAREDLDLAPASFLAQALTTAGTHSIELGDEAPLPELRRTRCLVVHARLADRRPGALLAWARPDETLNADAIPFLETVTNLLSAAYRRERAEALQSASEARYADLVAISPDGIVTLDEGGAVTSCNPAAAAILGRPASALMGARLAESPLIEESERAAWLAAFHGLLAGERLPPQELWMLTDDGNRRLLEVNGRVAAQGAGREIVAILRDVTERHRLEEQLRLSQRLESLGLLAGGVAHDFNNVLTVVLTSAALIADDERVPTDLRELAAEIGEAGERAADLTRQLLAFSRRQVLSPGPVDLSRVTADLQKMLRRLIGEDIELRVDLAHGLGTVHVDRSQFEQALINLCVNARAAMPRGGLLTITSRTRRVLQPPADRPQLAAGAYAEVIVADTGVGMTKATLSRIFEPFFTTKGPGEGTGLGLAMVHGFVQQSGGHVWAESEPGKGSAFHILLPLQGGDDDVARTQRALKITPGQGRILLVEDEPLVRGIAARILRSAGYDVIECEGPDDALARFDAAAVDLVVSDVVMPGMSGPALLGRLRAIHPGLRAIFVSGYPRGQQGEALAITDAPVVQKPFTPEGLSEAVHAALRG